jgi:glutamate 5-kinase
MTQFDFKIVGKIGSMALINKYNQDMDYNIISRLSRELKPGMIWVTSGAIEIGRLDYIKRNGKELDIPLEDAKTDYSSQGQSILMAQYRQYVDSRYSIRQILVEHQHFNDPIKREHLKKMFMRAPSENAIPIVNYNDAVSYEETRKLEIQNLVLHNENVVQCVDNDETASQIAALVNTEYLLILSNIDGIYDNPDDPSSLVKEIRGKDYTELVQNIDEYQLHCIGASRQGAGGAKAKLEYIKKPLENGTTVIIANSKYFIKDILAGIVPRTIIHVD